MQRNMENLSSSGKEALLLIKAEIVELLIRDPETSQESLKNLARSRAEGEESLAEFDWNDKIFWFSCHSRAWMNRPEGRRRRLEPVKRTGAPHHSFF